MKINNSRVTYNSLLIKMDFVGFTVFNLATPPTVA